MTALQFPHRTRDFHKDDDPIRNMLGLLVIGGVIYLFLKVCFG